MSTRYDGEASLSFIAAMRLIPPARTFASGPYLARRDVASSTDPSEK
jgi:hypothetical protein